MQKLNRLIPVLVLLFSGCQPQIQLQQISESEFGAFEADLAALDQDTLAVAWYDTRHSQGEIYLRILDGELNFKSPEIRISDTPSDSYEPDVVFHQGELAVTWYEIDADGNGSVWLGMWSEVGELVSKRRLSNTSSNARIPVIETIGDQLFVSWLQKPKLNANGSAPEIVGTWIDVDRLELINPFHISIASDTTWNINLSVQAQGVANEVLVAFDAEFDTASSELYLAHVKDESIRVNLISSDDGYPSKYPDIAWRSGIIALTWFDNVFSNNEIFLSVGAFENYFQENTKDLMELVASRVTYTEGDSIGAYLALSNDKVSVAWSDNDSGSYQIFLQNFAHDMNPIGERQQISYSDADSYIPSVVQQEEAVIMAWNDLMVSAHDSPNNLSRSEIFVSTISESP